MTNRLKKLLIAIAATFAIGHPALADSVTTQVVTTAPLGPASIALEKGAVTAHFEQGDAGWVIPANVIAQVCAGQQVRITSGPMTNMVILAAKGLHRIYVGQTGTEFWCSTPTHEAPHAKPASKPQRQAVTTAKPTAPAFKLGQPVSVTEPVQAAKPGPVQVTATYDRKNTVTVTMSNGVQSFSWNFLKGEICGSWTGEVHNSIPSHGLVGAANFTIKYQGAWVLINNKVVQGLTCPVAIVHHGHHGRRGGNHCTPACSPSPTPGEVSGGAPTSTTGGPAPGSTSNPAPTGNLGGPTPNGGNQTGTTGGSSPQKS